jgi:hypothetical protein
MKCPTASWSNTRFGRKTDARDAYLEFEGPVERNRPKLGSELAQPGRRLPNQGDAGPEAAHRAPLARRARLPFRLAAQESLALQVQNFGLTMTFVSSKWSQGMAPIAKVIPEAKLRKLESPVSSIGAASLRTSTIKLQKCLNSAQFGPEMPERPLSKRMDFTSF